MTDIRTLCPKNFEEIVRDASVCLHGGGIILYPTDTLYGLGVDATNPEALQKLHALKERDPSKPVYSIFDSFAATENFVEMTQLAETLAKAFLPGALTLILSKNETAPPCGEASDGSLGIRIPKNDLCLQLAEEFKKPYTATSANISGQETPNSVREILLQFGEHAKNIDMVIDAGTLASSLPSTIVDARGSIPVILREGAIPTSDIMNAISGIV